MKQGELLVAKLGKGSTVTRLLDFTGDDVVVALGRNKQARIPRSRIMFKTGLIAVDEDGAERFRRRVKDAEKDVDVAEIWDVVTDDQGPPSIDAIAELVWGNGLDMANQVAVVIQLDESPDYFECRLGRYKPLPRSSVAETVKKREREAERAKQAQTLMNEWGRGRVVEKLTEYQEDLLDLLRDYAIHGEEHRNAKAAKELLMLTCEGSGDLQRRCFEMLVRVQILSPDEPLEIHRAGLQVGFSRNVLIEAGQIDTDTLVHDDTRLDLTDKALFTIDYDTTEDRDDAISVEESDGGVVIGIHIADAGAMIPAGSAVDREAGNRMSTLYLPDGNISMLPHDVVRGGSLDPGEIKGALSLMAKVSDSGEVTNWELNPSVIRSKAALSYSFSDRAIGEANDAWNKALNRLKGVAIALRRKREAEGAVLIDRGELVIGVDESGWVKVSVRRLTPASDIVAELMILCNSLLAEFCFKEKIPAAYRCQSPVDMSGITNEQGMIVQLRRYLMMRQLMPAYLDLIPAPHAGLGVPVYFQATSPLRRYPDLVMQRQISHYIVAGKEFYAEEEIASVAQRAEVQLRELMGIEEQRKRYWFIKFLEQSLDRGQEDRFAAVVLENEPRRSALLELVEYPFRLRADLQRSYEPGEVTTLRLCGVDKWRRVGQWVHTNDGYKGSTQNRTDVGNETARGTL